LPAVRPPETIALKIDLEMHAPKVKPHNVRVNMMIRDCEPQSWQRPTQSRYGRWRLVDTPENRAWKAKLREKFDLAYPRFEPIEHRRLGLQCFFQTAYDSNDADNLAKNVCDAFNKKIWYDDRQVKELYSRVHVWPSKPFVQIVVYLLEVGA
jgi:Holliday junction resolvase RusA-like endonuclease